MLVLEKYNCKVLCDLLVNLKIGKDIAHLDAMPD